MSEAEPAEEPASEAGRFSSPRGRWWSVARAATGPVLIVVSVLAVLHAFAFSGLITTQHGDILSAWLPYHCYLGQSLRQGHVPTWNPTVMGGVPFAADPQSGWLSAPVMILYTLLPCSAAIRWYLILQPVLGGLGGYWFLRSEGVSRVGSTAAGSIVALVAADSYLALQLPFAGTVAWTALILAAASRAVHAERWSRRLLWGLATAVAWGQLAEVHLSHGLVTGTVALALYLAVWVAWPNPTRRSRARDAAFGLALLVAPVLVNAAILWPRIRYLTESTLALGYDRLVTLTLRYGSSAPAVPTALHQDLAGELRWPLGLAQSPGAYLGAAGLALVFAGWWTGRHRRLLTFAFGFAVLTYVVARTPVVNLVTHHVTWLPLEDFYKHAYQRFRYGTILAIALAVGPGVDAWLDQHRWRTRLLMVLPAVVLWWALPAAVGFHRAWPPLVIVGMVLAVAALAATASASGHRRRWLAFALPGVILAELVANGFVGHGGSTPPGAVLPPLKRPSIDAAAYLRPGPFVDTLRRAPDRYLVLSAKGFNRAGRAPFLRDRRDWVALADQRAMLFGLQDIGGYNPVQLVRYWSFVRTVTPGSLNYNSAFLTQPVPIALDLLDVGWIVARSDRPPPVTGATPVDTDGRWTLYRIPAAPRASVITRWTVAPTADAAREAVAEAGFDPSSSVVVERRSAGLPEGSGTGASGGTADYRSVGPQSAEVTVDAPSPAVVLIRTPFDRGWTATVDGHSRPVIPADYVDQGVAVPAGHHVIELRYEDPAIGQGLVASVVVIAVILGVAAWLARRERRRRAGASSA